MIQRQLLSYHVAENLAETVFNYQKRGWELSGELRLTDDGKYEQEMIRHVEDIQEERELLDA